MQDVGEIMDSRVIAVAAEDRLLTVDDIMTLGNLRHMPVVRSGRLVGVVAERDLLRASRSHLEYEKADDRRAFLNSVEVSQVMSSPAIVIDAKASPRNAARVMAENAIGCLPVTDDMGELLGMLTAGDLLAHLARGD